VFVADIFFAKVTLLSVEELSTMITSKALFGSEDR